MTNYLDATVKKVTIEVSVLDADGETKTENGYNVWQRKAAVSSRGSGDFNVNACQKILKNWKLLK